MSNILINPNSASITDLQTLMAANPVAIASLIDHTLLKATASQIDVSSICVEAIKYGFASVCINPLHVELTAELLKGTAVKTCTVIGFPLGATTTKDKVQEAKRALKNGAQEIDMVINIGALKAGYPNVVYEDIEAVVHAAHKRKAICKVIIETCYLTDKEKITACELAVRAGADFVKTSTGFGGGGATVEDVALMRKTVGDKAGVKASGGVRSLADAQAMVAAGANRIGASSGVQIMQEALGLTDDAATEESDY